MYCCQRKNRKDHHEFHESPILNDPVPLPLVPILESNRPSTNYDVEIYDCNVMSL
jgi:hypothetical protein